MRSGCVFLVGAGPGDPGLLTLKGREVLAGADVVVFDALAPAALLAYAPPQAERIFVGKRAGQHAMKQEDVNELLVSRARAGDTVVRLKGGDPFVFGRGAEEASALAAAGIPFQVVPGVTAATAVAAYAGIPLTHRDLASCVTLITGHEAAGKDEPGLDWKALAALGGTIAIYMGVRRLDETCSRLMAEGLDPATPAAAIEWGTTPRQRTVAAELGTLAAAAADARLEPPALVVIGQVVAMRDAIGWSEEKPMFGLRVVVTRAAAQAGEFVAGLRDLGADVVEFPTIRMAPPAQPGALRHAAERAREFDWIVFTSVNGVQAFMDALGESALDARALAGCRVAAIGPATAGRLREHGIRADLQPESHTSAAMAEALSGGGVAGKRILCPQADLARDELRTTLEAAGARVEGVEAYRVLPETPDPAPLVEMLSRDEVAWLTFTSPSAARSFFALVDVEAVRNSRARVASIGPVTSGALRELGVEPSAEAAEHTVLGLIDAMLQRPAAGGSA
jgi:uroporphyrinogen III methyltransferase/synthase